MVSSLSLLRQRHPLADPKEQRAILRANGRFRPFARSLADAGLWPLRADGIRVLQINVGKKCNQACAHCHVDAGPDRREVMTRETIQACLDAVARGRIPVVDITGGAPEMNPHFRWLVAEARVLGTHVIDRCNLTILLASGFRDLPKFLAEHRVEIVASLPCYLEENTDKQRGDGVFGRSIAALRELNALGYGHAGSGLELTLVYNPVGPTLPPDQATLEAAYRRELGERYGIVFSRLYTITNLPISRFLEDLLRTGRYEQYMQVLIDAFNPAAVRGLMCRTMLSVGWDGRLFDCDFNQMLDLELAGGQPRHIAGFDPDVLAYRPIVTAQHCYGCTAGCGSSCQGSIVGADSPPDRRGPGTAPSEHPN
ncbi:arsenosugar biosynthesis radical SAM (seleno)protein ArsS [Tautonia sociabilis]|uniref:Radical SAM/Cys-rich domain protein n=1 Tax=Tautonia sociabilis TaxID=2080755 RepID=A0A432MKL6_9BACT|nr:arsenosugar biosynthesis radical SAM (seleno)protein ArsS [Tautonia sociabilis]RUL87951.1 radical SAM/Cys-rich domain protein [Tautonia sociabilis]